MKPKGESPDYNVAAMTRDGSRKANIGVAWVKANGEINVRLNPFVALFGSQDLVITLFPTEIK